MKRSYGEIDAEILKVLKKDPRSINEICRHLDANWSTVNTHLQHLEKIGVVKIILNKKRLRLYGLSK